MAKDKTREKAYSPETEREAEVRALLSTPEGRKKLVERIQAAFLTARLGNGYIVQPAPDSEGNITHE